MSEDDLRLWERVCATVRKLGAKAAKQPCSPPLVLNPPLNRSFLDLHGCTVEEAHKLTREYLEETDFKAVTIITGKSGAIRQEFPRWMNLWGYRFINTNGDGAFRVNTKRIIVRPR